jgi:catechol 2,3-dioxygenase-like lactoylglutathione lyase family enzyme
MAPAFHHVAIQCVDLAACERFYREVLGLEVVRRWPGETGGDRSVWLALGEGFLALERAGERRAPNGSVERPAPFRDGKPGLHLLALRIAPSERAGWEARLAHLGVPVVHRTRWTLYCQDPEGNRIGLSHHPDDVEGA